MTKFPSLAISQVSLVSAQYSGYKRWVVALMLFFSAGLIPSSATLAAESEINGIVIPPTGTVVIIEDTVPNGPQDFEFRPDDEGLTEGFFRLDDDDDGTLSNTQTISSVISGSYGVSQTPVGGYGTTVSCVDPDNESTIAGTTTALIDLDEGETVTCTFTNYFCPSFPIEVASEEDLNLAIACYNVQTAAGDYAVNLTTDITLSASLPSISNTIDGIKLLIDGTSVSDGRSTLDGVDAHHPFEVDEETVVEISNLIITNGLARGADPSRDHRQNDGGGIRNLGELTLTDVEVSSSEAEDEGGGIYSEEGSELTIIRGLIKQNVAEDEGGGLFMEEGSYLELMDSVVDDNESQSDGGRGGGGGISNYGEAYLVNTAVTNNRGVPKIGEREFNESYGGGIDNLGDMEIYFDDSVSANPSIISNNSAYDGGGVSNEGYLEISDTTIANNDAEFGAGISIVTSIEFAEEEVPSGSGSLPEIAVPEEYIIYGVTYVIRSTITENTAVKSGGGISNYGELEGLFVPIGDIATSGSEVPIIGPGFPPNLVIDDSTISYNTAGLGGGLENFMAGAKVHGSTINHNQAIQTSRSESCCFAIPYSGGGGVFNTGQLAIDNSTLSQNAALLPDFPPIELGDSEVAGDTPSLLLGIGGGILNLSAGLGSIHNTLSGNTAAGSGGGIYNGFVFDGSPMGEILAGEAALDTNEDTSKVNPQPHRRSQRISRTTSIANTGAVRIGASVIADSVNNVLPDGRSPGPVSFVGLTNTIIANSQSGEPLQDGGDCVNQDPSMYSPFATEVFDGGYNLIEESAEDGQCGFMASPANNNIIGQDPMLAELADNGGETKTHALLSTSPALDASNPFFCGDMSSEETSAAGLLLESPFSHDQRGVSRPQGMMPLCDIGAVEMRSSSITLTKVVDNEGGGTLLETDFVLSVTVDGNITLMSSGGSVTFLENSSVMLGETATNQYAFDSISGAACPADLDVEFEVDAGSALSCTITNCFDLDNDGLCSAVDPDDDNDTIDDPVDNCPLIANPGQANFDFDPIGDVCDPDDDNDGMPDEWEEEHGLGLKNSWDRDLDPDGDGFTNLEEFLFGSDPNVFDQDENQNGIPDSVENKVNIVPILQLLLLDE